MTAYFCDSSAIVKRYIVELGSAWLSAKTDPKNGLVYVARITFVEVISAITRRETGKHISIADADNARSRFEDDYHNELQKVEISESLIAGAALLARNMPYEALTLCNSLRPWKQKKTDSSSD